MQPASRIALVVEDDPTLQDRMKRHLATARFDVLTASDYHTAITHVQRRPLHVACIDLGLPNESGFELCERIRTERALRFVPIVVTSERNFPVDMVRAEEAGANAFLKKPFSMPLLTDCLEMLMAGGAESRPPMRRLRQA
jgi:DNA-binding response OmpR family regulator